MSKEWSMIQELHEIIDDLSPKQREMVVSWFENIDPNDQFLNQQSEKQWKWLHWMHAKYVLGDNDLARGFYD